MLLNKAVSFRPEIHFLLCDPSSIRVQYIVLLLCRLVFNYLSMSLIKHLMKPKQVAVTRAPGLIII